MNTNRVAITVDQINEVGQLSLKASVAYDELESTDRHIEHLQSQKQELLDQIAVLDSDIDFIKRCPYRENLDTRIRVCHAYIERILGVKVVDKKHSFAR